MPADIHAIVFVAHGARNAAHEVALLKDDRLDIGTFYQFKSGCEPGRARSDDESFTLGHSSLLAVRRHVGDR